MSVSSFTAKTLRLLVQTPTWIIMSRHRADHFELKIRGRIGEGCAGPNVIRILNRCVKLTIEGLIYEAAGMSISLPTLST